MQPSQAGYVHDQDIFDILEPRTNDLLDPVSSIYIWPFSSPEPFSLACSREALGTRMIWSKTLINLEVNFKIFGLTFLRRMKPALIFLSLFCSNLSII
jgi:hypothetical protein